MTPCFVEQVCCDLISYFPVWEGYRALPTQGILGILGAVLMAASCWHFRILGPGVIPAEFSSLLCTILIIWANFLTCLCLGFPHVLNGSNIGTYSCGWSENEVS